MGYWAPSTPTDWKSYRIKTLEDLPLITKFEFLVPEGIISLSHFVLFELLTGILQIPCLGRCLETLLIVSRIQDKRFGLERSLLGFFFASKTIQTNFNSCFLSICLQCSIGFNHKRANGIVRWSKQRGNGRINVLNLLLIPSCEWEPWMCCSALPCTDTGPGVIYAGLVAQPSPHSERLSSHQKGRGRGKREMVVIIFTVWNSREASISNVIYGA